MLSMANPDIEKRFESLIGGDKLDINNLLGALRDNGIDNPSELFNVAKENAVFETFRAVCKRLGLPDSDFKIIVEQLIGIVSEIRRAIKSTEA
jgi:hypothetical protein